MAVAAEIARHAHKTPALAYPRGALPGQRTQPCGPREQQCTGFADTRLHRLNSIDSRHSAESLPLAHHRLNGLLLSVVAGRFSADKVVINEGKQGSPRMEVL